MSDQGAFNTSYPLKYVTFIPNMADDDLNPYQYRLLGHYARVCGEAVGGVYGEGTRATAERCKMSPAKVVSTRRELAKLGYIVIEEPSDPSDTIKITLCAKS